MKRIVAITAVLVIAFAALASAQETTTAKPLAAVAKEEEARRKTVRKPARVFTNDSLKIDPSAGGASPAPATAAGAPGVTPAPAPAEEEAAAGPVKDQKYWSGRIKDARTSLARTQVLHDSLQSRVNALTADAANRDYPARGQIEAQRNAALAELERMKKELVDQTNAIATIEDEARRAGVPVGWLRPGA